MTGAPTVLFCVGATKAGTSWLYRYLARHEDCHLRSIKELHYFDMIETGNFQRHIARERARLAQLEAEAEAGAAGLDPAKARAKARQIVDLRDWLAVIGAGRADLDAYRAYLAEGRGEKRLVGDITPAYGLLPVARLAQMAAIGPDVRFVYLMRDPVARLWSQARMLAARKGQAAADFAARAAEAMGGLIDRIAAGIRDREDYAGAVARLKAAVAPSRLWLQLQDEMMTAPGLARLCGFLGIASRSGDFDRRVHEGVPLALDEGLRQRAMVALRPQYDFVASLFGALPEAWRRNMIEGHA